VPAGEGALFILLAVAVVIVLVLIVDAVRNRRRPPKD
jgi:hypothetical protein